MVMVDALEGLLPITSQQIDEAASALVDMALAREQSLRRDHPMVGAEFTTTWTGATTRTAMQCSTTAGIQG